jgi:penicillin amidase/acyl-homoserine-lactone acylase
MLMSKHLGRYLFLFAPLIAMVLLPYPGAADDAGKSEEITIYRDDFGIPNIFAPSEEGAAFGMGYAQAEDRLEELLKQYRRCEGTMAEAFGPEFLRDDYRQRLWRHRAVAEANYPKLPAHLRALIEAYQAGIKHYMNEHSEQVPGWAPPLAPWQIVALGRYIIWGWPEGDAGGDLERAGIKPDPVSARGSNQWVVTPSRTADGFALALIDPHLGWYGPFRFYEARLYGGDMALAGMSIPGLPFSSLGHNRYCSVAMTTGGPDAADVYEEELNPTNPRQYKVDGAWRDLSVRQEVIRVKEGDQVKEHTFEIASTIHGPVVAHRAGKAYAMKLPYADEYRLIEQSYGMAKARNLAEMKKALSLLQLMEQNIMVATVEGDVFYVRNGRVPIRPPGYDWKRPVPGNTQASEWRGIHPFEDLIQLTNPWQGYLQNCNVSPEFMTRFCPLMPERYASRPYLYNPDNPLHQRAATVLQLLDLNGRVTVRDAIDIAMSPLVYNAELWQARLVNAWQRADAVVKADAKAAKLYELIVRWNRREDPDSTGAIAYRFWKEQLGDKVRQSDRAGLPPPEQVTGEQLVHVLAAGAEALFRQWGRLEVSYGEVYRVGRAGSSRTWPVGGGSIHGMSTPRAISFEPQKDGRTFLAHGGQTSTQVVQLSNPPRSWTLLPLGESDHPSSKHWDDQAEKLFSPGKLKPTYFLDKEELLKHVESTKVLHRDVR